MNMDTRLHELIAHLSCSDPATETEIAEFEQTLRIKLPSDYVRFLRITDGAEGWVGPAQNSYLMMDSIASVLEARARLAYAPKWFVLFGSSGGGEAYGFDTRCDPMPVIETDWFWELMNTRGTSFMDFLEYLASRDPEA